MSKRKRQKHKRPHHGRAAPRKAEAVRREAEAGEPEGAVLRIARVACLVGLPALLLVSPGWSFMRAAALQSENSLFQWNCVEVFVIVVAGLWLVAVALGQVRRVRLHWVDAALIGFFLVTLLASLLVPYRFDAFRRLKEMLAGVAFYVVAKNLFADERRQRTLVSVLMGMLGLLAVVGVVHYMWYVLDIKLVDAQGRLVPFLGSVLDPDRVPWEKEFGVRATSIDGNPNFLAGSLLVLVLVGLAWLVTHRRPRVPAGPLAAAIIWVVVVALLLGIASGANKRFAKVEAEARQLLQSGSAPAEQQDLVQRHRNAREGVGTLAHLTMAWTALGVAGFVLMLCLWPFFATTVAVVLGFALLLFTNSWAAYIGFVVGVAVLALLVFVKRPPRFRPTVAAGLGGALAVALLGFFAIKALSHSYIIPPREAQTGLRSREILWDTVPRMVKARPVLGFGADNFFAYCNKYMSRILPGPSKYEDVMVLNPVAFGRVPGQPPPRRITLFPEEDAPPGTVSLLTPGKRLVMEKHAAVFINNPSFIERNPGRIHSEYLSALVDAGAVGLVVFVAIFVLFYTGTLGAWRRGEDSWRGVIFLGTGAAIAGIAGMQTVDFPFRLPWATCLIAAALALGTAWHRGRDLALRARVPAALRMALALVVSAAGIYLLVGSWRQVQTLRLGNRTTEEFKNRAFPTDDVLNAYSRLVARGSRDHNVYFGLAEMLLYLGKLDGVGGHDTKYYLERVARIQPYHEKVQYLWGQYYSEAGDVDRAVEHYRRALELEPRYLTARIVLIDTLVRADRLDEANAAIAEAWRWEPESRARTTRARRSRRVKMEAGLAVIEPQDLYWPWVMNAGATVRALEGDFDAARKGWAEAERRWTADRGGLAAVEQGLYGLYPDPPIFFLNPETLARTTPDQVLEDPAGWAKRFRGVADYQTFKRIEDEYKACLRWGGLLPLPGGPPPIMSREEAARRALPVLDRLVATVGEEALVTDGNQARDYHNRRGLLMVNMGRVSQAIEEFDMSAQGAGGDVARANAVALRNLAPDRRLVLGPIDEWAFAQIHSRLAELQSLRYGQRVLSPQQYVAGLKPWADRYPQYMPVAMVGIPALVEAGYRDAARAHLRLLEGWYPDDPRPRQLRAQLGL